MTDLNLVDPTRPGPPEFVVTAKGAIDPDAPAIYLRLEALLDILTHVPAAARHELGGLLAGQAYTDSAGRFVLVERALPAPAAASTRVSLTFTPEAWDELWEAKERECPDSRIVGWYHTHPALGVFLSEQDRFIHRHFFAEAYDLALVFDSATFTWGVFRWDEGDLALAPGFYVYAEADESTPDLERTLREMDPAWIIRLGAE
jgi:proteasome lid subunit RPN8/RPN11